MKKNTIINNIKKFQETLVNADWLNNGQKNLQSFIAENPVRNLEFNRHNRQRVSFKKLISKPMPIAMFAIMLSLVTGSGIVTASQSSLPTDKLYPVKLMMEKVEEAVTFNEVKKVALQTKLADERLEEIQSLQAQGKATKVMVEKNLQEYQNKLTKAQEYLVDVSVGNKIIEPKIVATSLDLEKAVSKQQATIRAIEDRAPAEYKEILEEGRKVALNSSGQIANSLTVEGGVGTIKEVVEEKEISSVVTPINDKIISEETALKIAAEAGLAKGIKEWTTKLYWHEGKINNYVWAVSNFLSKYNGQTVIIDAISGKVYEIINYQITVTPPAPIEEKEKPSICPKYIDCMPKIIEPGEKPASCQIPDGCEGITQIVY